MGWCSMLKVLQHCAANYKIVITCIHAVRHIAVLVFILLIRAYHKKVN